MQSLQDTVNWPLTNQNAEWEGPQSCAFVCREGTLLREEVGWQSASWLSCREGTQPFLRGLDRITTGTGESCGEAGFVTSQGSSPNVKPI